MMMDWPNIWYDEYRQYGEAHLFILPNAEHTCSTNMYGVISAASAFCRSIASGHTVRPDFNYTYDPKTGSIEIRPTPGFKPTSVVMHHTETMQSIRRDFRWIRATNDRTPACEWPFIALPKPIFGGDCLQFLWWSKKHATETAPGVYTVTPPEPKKEGNWVGYHVEVSFAVDDEHITAFKDKFTFSTPGYTWPDTLPFEDCNSNDPERPCIEQIV